MHMELLTSPPSQKTISTSHNMILNATYMLTMLKPFPWTLGSDVQKVDISTKQPNHPSHAGYATHPAVNFLGPSQPVPHLLYPILEEHSLFFPWLRTKHNRATLLLSFPKLLLSANPADVHLE